MKNHDSEFQMDVIYTGDDWQEKGRELKFI